MGKLRGKESTVKLKVSGSRRRVVERIVDSEGQGRDSGQQG